MFILIIISKYDCVVYFARQAAKPTRHYLHKHKKCMLNSMSTNNFHNNLLSFYCNIYINIWSIILEKYASKYGILVLYHSCISDNMYNNVHYIHYSFCQSQIQHVQTIRICSYVWSGYLMALTQ